MENCGSTGRAKQVGLNYNCNCAVRTKCCQAPSFVRRGIKFAMPIAAVIAIRNTWVVQSARGLPTFLTYLSDAGRKDIGQNVVSLRRLPSGALAAFPSRRSCCLATASVRGAWLVSRRTVALLTLDMKAGAIPQIERRHRQWKPSNRLRPAALNHREDKPYVNLLRITALYISTFLCRLKLECPHLFASLSKSARAAPSRRESSLFASPVSEIRAPK